MHQAGRQREGGVNTFHLSLEVPDLSGAIEFYRNLFGVEPIKMGSDYAMFDLADPPLVLALRPGGPALSHLGIHVRSTEEVEMTSERLHASGMSTLDERGIVSSDSIEDKVWVTDPAGYRWEIYTVLGDVDDG
jgi:catechol 2,3-dioxygenase-like lactoylglutathione lyase family enzyme